MKTSRQNVWSVLKGEKADYIPKGEVLITDDIIKAFPHPELEDIIALLDADLVTLPIGPSTPKSVWKDWASKPYFAFGLLDGPFSLAGNTLEWNKVLRLMRKDPIEAQNVMRKLMEENLKNALNALDQGCEGIVIYEAIGSDGGLLFSPTFLKENYLPLLEEIYSTLEAHNVPLLFHSVGNILQLIPHLKEIGFWGVQGLQPSSGIHPEIFLPEEKHFTYWGNFEFEKSERLKTSNEVAREVPSLLDSWSEFPGYIFGSYGGLYKGLLPEVIATAYQSVYK